MFRDSNSYGTAVARHPDGSINFDAYRAVARRERHAAIAASIECIARAANALLASVGTALAAKFVRHPPHHAR